MRQTRMRTFLPLFAAILSVIAASRLPAQLSFEVASIKPAPPQPMGRTSISTSTDQTRLNYQNVSIADLIAGAYRVQHRQVAGPDWMDTQRFDVVAKYPAGVGESSVPEMLRSLLAERFGLRFHDETREIPVYAIMPAKTGPKMSKAEKTGDFNSTNGKALSHIVATTRIADLADNLSGKLDRPVVDQSGLEGAWVIDLTWTPDSSDAAAADATAPSIFKALQEQLGLRLVPVKSPVRFIVVDRVEKSPSEN